MPGSSEEEKSAAKERLTKRLSLFEQALASQQFVLGDGFTVADCCLFVMLFWAKTKVGLDIAPSLSAYYDRLVARYSVAKALADEGLG